MPTILITGGNSTIGLEFVRQYLGAGWHVVATYRNPETAGDLMALANSNLRIERFDAANISDIPVLKIKLGDLPIDIFLNNAARQGGPSSVSSFGQLSSSEWLDVLLVNSIAPIKIAEAFIENIRASISKRIVFISSRAGSIALRGNLPHNMPGGDYLYRSSKAALNASARSLAFDLKSQGISILILHPGYVRTKSTGFKADISASESVEGMRSVIHSFSLEKTGVFLDHTGQPVPW